MGHDLGFTILSAGAFRATDLQELLDARWEYWVPNGGSGVVPPPLQSHPVSGFHWENASLGFAAFVRKADTGLQELLERRVKREEDAAWEIAQWPLAQRAWNVLEAPALCQRLGQVAFHTWRRSCDGRETLLPCAAEFLMKTDSCPVTLRVREKMAVGSGRVFALQVGFGWDPILRMLAMPSIITHAALASSGHITVLVFPVVRRRADVARASRVRVNPKRRFGKGPETEIRPKKNCH